MSKTDDFMDFIWLFDYLSIPLQAVWSGTLLNLVYTVG